MSKENKKIKIAIDTLGGDHGKSGFGSYILYFISNLPKDSDFEIPSLHDLLIYGSILLFLAIIFLLKIVFKKK